MYRILYSTIFIIFILLAGCSYSTEYSDEDVVAIVKGEEITIGDLRFLYSDEELFNMLDGTIKAKLVIQEAKKMNIDVSKEIKDTIEARSDYPPDDIDTESANLIREFAEPQAKKLGLTPEEYYQNYIETTTEIGAYINAYFEEVFGVPEDIFNDEQANEHLNELVSENKDEIEILITN